MATAAIKRITNHLAKRSNPSPTAQPRRAAMAMMKFSLNIFIFLVFEVVPALQL